MTNTKTPDQEGAETTTVRTTIKAARSSPLWILLTFLVPAVLVQVFGRSDLLDIAANWAFPPQDQFGTASVELVPMPSTKAGEPSPADVDWAELLLFLHSSGDTKDVTVLGPQQTEGVLIGAPVPVLVNHAGSADPRIIPLFQAKLPPATLMASAVPISEDLNAQGEYKLLSGGVLASFRRDQHTILAMTSNQYRSLNILWAFAAGLLATLAHFYQKRRHLDFTDEDAGAVQSASANDERAGAISN